jgi:hypothetical protein
VIARDLLLVGWLARASSVHLHDLLPSSSHRRWTVNDDMVCHQGGRHGGSWAGEEADVVDRVIREKMRNEHREVQCMRGGGGRDSGSALV